MQERLLERERSQLLGPGSSSSSGGGRGAEEGAGSGEQGRKEDEEDLSSPIMGAITEMRPADALNVISYMTLKVCVGSVAGPASRWACQRLVLWTCPQAWPHGLSRIAATHRGAIRAVVKCRAQPRRLRSAVACAHNSPGQGGTPRGHGPAHRGAPAC
jgi:hypothetical protein